jgi:hypothetical protein
MIFLGRRLLSGNELGSEFVIVLAESNFVLELALRQEQFEHAERILNLAEERHLPLPAPTLPMQKPPLRRVQASPWQTA